MAERKAGCGYLASPTGIANPHSSAMRGADVTQGTVDLNDWGLSTEDRDCYSCT